MAFRLRGFDYTRPFYYMVTLKRRSGLAAFSAIGERGVVENAITRAFDATIKNFHLKWPVVEPIWCFAVMPDHVHLLVKLAAGERKMALGSVVFQLMKALTAAYWRSWPGQNRGPARRSWPGQNRDPVLLRGAPSPRIPRVPSPRSSSANGTTGS